MHLKKRKQLWIITGAIVLLLGVPLFMRMQGSQAVQEGNGIHLTVYKSSTCGCCANYVRYMKREGYDVEVIDQDNMEEIKEKYGVPPSETSCHTTIVGNEQYIVEGHIPVEGIEALLDRKPQIKGIAMGGMPQGSPGMPGKKIAPFAIYSFDENGELESFLSL